MPLTELLNFPCFSDDYPIPSLEEIVIGKSPETTLLLLNRILVTMRDNSRLSLTKRSLYVGQNQVR